ASQPTRIYGFLILYNYDGLSAERGQLTVSNIAEFGTYADGSWPSSLYFAQLQAQQKKKYGYVYFHSDGYKSYTEAKRMREALIELFSTDCAVNETFIDASVNDGGQHMDFWETEVITGK